MGARESKGPGQFQRDQTDESLRAERDKADASAGERRDALDVEADAVVQIARERADLLLKTARDDADRERSGPPTDAEVSSDLERARADVLLERDRSRADAALESERARRRRFLSDFLAAEREATDSDLSGERARADQVIATRDEFLATVSHDLRSLLSGLSLGAELLVRHAPEGKGDDVGRQAARMQRMVARMSRLINDLLDVASIEAGKLALLPEQVEVTEIVRDTIDAFETLATSKRIALVAGTQQGPIHCRMDPGRVLQVLANLVSNALKFTPAEGRVVITFRTEGTELIFSVSDTGIGIAADALQAVFEQFRQVSKDRGGLGLGLHISKCLVEAHGGRIWAESKLGAGSTFHFALPLSSSAGMALPTILD